MQTHNITRSEAGSCFGGIVSEFEQFLKPQYIIIYSQFTVIWENTQQHLAMLFDIGV